MSALTERILAALAVNHLADLRNSGLSDQQIIACGFRTLRHSSEVASILKWKSATKLGECLLLPYRLADGSLIPTTEFARIKPDKPRTDKPKDGKQRKFVKYESPKGSRVRLYFPPDSCKVLADASVPLLITEGEKKSARADQEGFACIGLGGVWAWTKKRERDSDGKKIGKLELIADFDEVALNGRQVFITFDPDVAENTNVQRAEWSLSQALGERGAIVRVVRLPPGPLDADGSPTKIGLDDFLCRHSADELRELLDAALPPQKPRPNQDSPNEAPDDPHRLARLFIEQHCTLKDGVPILWFWRDECWIWDQNVYRTVPASDLKARLAATIKNEFDRLNLIELKQPRDDEEKIPTVRKVTASLLTNTTIALTSLRLLDSSMTQPGWLNGAEPFPANEVFATESGLIHIPSLVSGKPSRLESTPWFFSTNVVGYEFLPNAECPNWMNFLKSLWPNDSQSIDCLQEWFGYLLLADTQHHKLLLMIGPPRSGKGTIAKTLKSLIGVRNLACPTLSSLSENFGLWPLLGKTVALIPEARLGRNADAIAVVERLLSISGGDPQDVHRKNLPTLNGITLPIRFVLTTNELPNLCDSSGAFVNRVVLLRAIQSWLGKEDKQLDSRLQLELPGILNWAIHGWQRLNERGHFLQPDSGRELLSDLNDLSSPVSQFVRDKCILGPEFEASIADLFEVWREWCEEHGRHTGTRETFGKNLRAKFPGLSVTQPRAPDGGRIRLYNGIGLISGTRWHASQSIAHEGHLEVF